MARRRRSPFTSVRTPPPGSVVILACDEDGLEYSLAVPLEVFTGTGWGGTWPKLAADARAALLEMGHTQTA